VIPIWSILVLVVTAMVIGVIGNRWVRRRHPLEDTGFGVKELVGPVTTLGVVLMAFVMAQSLASYGRARENVGTEARVVNEMAESAQRLDDTAAAARVQSDLVCYARAVRGREWGPMDVGERAPEVSLWADALQVELATLKRAGDDSEIGRLIDLDSQRAAARVARITESSPTNPDGLNWLMLGTVTVSIVGLGLFVNVKGDPLVHVAILGVLAVVLTGTLYMINDLDQPFTGLNTLKPTDMEHIERRIEGQLTAVSPQELPCDDEGDAA
jgi:hypothetical protein